MEVNGGAEFYARLLSEQLCRLYSVDVLTTCALDYATWEMHYPPGVENINGVTVRRFANHRRGYQISSKRAKWAFQQRKYHHRLLKALGVFWWIERNFGFFQPSLQEAHEHLQGQGPYSPDLLAYIQAHKDQYDAFVFVTYLYHPTAVGLLLAPEKSIFIPTAHDEPAIYSPYFRQLFHAPRWILYLTEAEKRFCEQLFGGLPGVCSEVVGVGIDIPEVEPEAAGQVLRKYKLPDRYILYMGRVDHAKNCHQLFAFYLKYAAKSGISIPLVVAGKANMRIPESPAIRHIGFVTDEEKDSLLHKALLCVIPSKYESLSLIALESYAAGKPILVNGQCEVLKDHVENSGVGKYYYTYADFERGLTKLLNTAHNPASAIRSRAYIEQSYQWKEVLEKFGRLIKTVEEGQVFGKKNKML